MKRFVVRPWLLVLSIFLVIVTWGLLYHYQWHYEWAHRCGLINIEPTEAMPIGNDRYIAHAGGALGDITYTNSKEAVLQSLKNGFRFIELDLRVTLDGHYYGAHYNDDFNAQTGHPHQWIIPPTASQVKERKILDRFTPLLLTDVAKIMAEHPQMFLVIDNGNDYAKMLSECPYPERMAVEVVNYAQYVSARVAGFKYVALGNNIEKETVEKLGIKILVVNHAVNPEDPVIKKFLAEGGLLMISGVDHARNIPPRLQSIPALFSVDWK